MPDVVYTADIRIERIAGPHRKAWVPGRTEPVDFGVHGAIAEHYGVDVVQEHTTTLDYLMAAAGG